MGVRGCAGCGILISLSIIPGGNPAARDPTRWARSWRMCGACGRLFCTACAPERSADDPCPGCATPLRRPDEADLLALMFPPERPPPAPAADATSRTWQDDLRIAVADGLPILDDIRVTDDGLPDVRDEATAQRYLRWLTVLAWLMKAASVIDRPVRIDLDGLRDEVPTGVAILVARYMTAWGTDDPHGPYAMRGGGRWAAPQPADLVAFALRCAWSERGGGKLEPYVAVELEHLAELERARATRIS